MGISLGAIWSADTDRLESWNLNLPYSFALDPERGAVVHANLGWNDPRGSNGAIIGGLSVEIALAQYWVLLGEALGDTVGGFLAQFGVRRSLSRDLSLDLLVGTQDSLDEPLGSLWVSTLFCLNDALQTTHRRPQRAPPHSLSMPRGRWSPMTRIVDAKACQVES